MTNELVVSLPAEKLVFKVDISVSGLKTAKIIPLAGNGRTCKGNGLCGDGDEAVKASLTYPKVNKNYFFVQSKIFVRSFK